MTSILDRRFKYYPASETDLRRTFRRVRREMSEQQASKTAVAPAKETAQVSILPVTKGTRVRLTA